jgi:DNA invertase Pin-like site-specific DNA recombinase
MRRAVERTGAQQDARRAQKALESFASERNLKIAANLYVENESGASLSRPELARLLSDCQPGDVLLVEQVDRPSRLSAANWDRLKEEIKKRGVRVVALDLPTSWQMATAGADEFTSRMFEAINSMMPDMIAAIARKDYDDRRRRQLEGIKKAKAEGRYRGRKEDVERNAAIVKMLESGQSWNSIVKVTGASRSTLSRLAARSKSGADRSNPR